MQKGGSYSMKSSRYTAEQVAFAMRQVESGTPVSEIYHNIGIAEQTCYRWRRSLPTWELPR